MTRHYTFRPEFTIVAHDDGRVTYEWDWGGSFTSSYDNATDESDLDDWEQFTSTVDRWVECGVLPKNGDWSPKPSPEEIKAALEHLASLTNT